MTAAIPYAISAIASGVNSYFGNKRARNLYNQNQAGFKPLLQQLKGNQNNDVINNRNLALGGLTGAQNQFGSSTYNYAPTGLKVNGQDVIGATLNQQLSPQAQGIFNNLLGQFNTGNIGGVKLNPDQGYLQRNINKAIPRFAARKQNIERQLIANGVTPGTPAWENAIRDLNRQEADELLGFEDKAFANDQQYQNHILNNQNNLLSQLQQLNAPNPGNSISSDGYDSSAINQLLTDNYNNSLNNELDLARNSNMGLNDALKLGLAGLNSGSDDALSILKKLFKL